LRIDAYVGAGATSICSDTFFLAGNANACPLAPDRTFSNIGFSTPHHHYPSTLLIWITAIVSNRVGATALLVTVVPSTSWIVTQQLGSIGGAALGAALGRGTLGAALGATLAEALLELLLAEAL
jgi:hypothetical protein